MVYKLFITLNNKTLNLCSKVSKIHPEIWQSLPQNKKSAPISFWKIDVKTKKQTHTIENTWEWHTISGPGGSHSVHLGKPVKESCYDIITKVSR